jgi:secreted trypsin-like serine protease
LTLHQSTAFFLKIAISVLLGLPILCAAQEADDPASVVDELISASVHRVDLPLIINGNSAQWENHRWQVALLAASIDQPLNALNCGGALVAIEWVLTAAHCVYGNVPGDVDVLSGTADLNSGGHRLHVKGIYLHRKYDAESSDYDIALLKLSGSATVVPIQPITLAEEDEIIKVGEYATVSGWGKTESARKSNQLKEVGVPLVSTKTCNAKIGYDGKVTDRMLCAGFKEGGKDSCQGDSGGPIVKDGRLIGVASWGEGCALPNKYGVYVRVAVLQNWIEQCISNPIACEVRRQ